MPGTSTRPIARRATAANRCPVCDAATKGCSTTDDGLHFCRGDAVHPTCWREVGSGIDPAGFRHYRRADDDRHDRNGHTPHTPPVIDWHSRAQQYAAALTPERRDELAAQLGLPAVALSALPLIGWHDSESCWTLPEMDAHGRAIGITRRFPDGAKRMMTGGKRGLTIPAGWRDRDGPLMLVEGASDVLALSLCGLATVGRPSNTGGVDLLAELLRDDRRDVLVIGENDAKPDGSWPGRDGAHRTADALSRRINRPVRWAMPPEGTKDSRAWVCDLVSGAADVLDWRAIGQTIRDAMLAGAEPKQTESVSADSCGELFVESLAGLKPQPVKWLVPNRVPAGMIGLIAGEGGHGKSMTTLELAAAVTTGRCAFGLEYPDPVRGKVLLISCEDDWTRTIVPRLAALGADLSRVLRIRGVKMKADGQTLDFHLGHFRELESLLKSDPEIRLVVIDPAGAYIGRAGVNENRDADLRAVLGPLSELANRTGCTVLLVKHLNKSIGASAVQRVSGSTGYVNAVRFAYLILPDPDDGEKKLLLPLKANILPAGQSGLAYRMTAIPPDEAQSILRDRWPDLPAADLDALSQQLFRQQWEPCDVRDANAVMQQQCSRKPGRESGVEACIEFIREYLGIYAHPEEELSKAVFKANFSNVAFKNAKARMRELDKDDEKRLSSKPLGLGGAWWVWCGIQSRRPPDRPSPHCIPD